jgi:hypothetical protein
MSAGDRCQHGYEGNCGKCERLNAIKYPPTPGKVARILAISDELWNDFAEPTIDDFRIPAQAFNDAYEKAKAARLALNYGMSAERLAEIYQFTDEDDDLDDEGLTIRGNLDVALWNYAKQFHIPAMEGEDLRGWYARVAPRLMTKSNGVTFLALLKAVVVAATGITDDELDELVKRKLATPHPGHVPYNPPSHAGTGCSGPCCTPLASFFHPACGQNHAPGTTCPTNQVPQRQTVLKDVDLGPLRSASPKDSLLNPPVKGFVGSDKLGYDSDYD